MVHLRERQYDYMEDVKANVLQKFPLLGVTVSKLNVKPTQIIQTAATDGKSIYFNPDFFADLNEDQRAFVYAHEVMHVAFNHILRSKDKQPKLWNIATDAVVNQLLKKEGYDILGEGVDIPEAINHSAEEMYDILMKEQQNQLGNNEQQNQSGNGEQQNGESGEQQNQSGNGEQQNGESGEQQNQSGNGEQQNGESGEQQNQSGNGEQQNGESGNSHSGHRNLSQEMETELTDEQSTQQHGHGLWQQAVADAENQQQGQKSLFNKIKKIFERDKQKENDNDTENKKEQNDEQKQEQILETDFLAENRRLRHHQQQRIKQQIFEHKKEVLTAIDSMGTSGGTYNDIGESKSVADWKKILKQNMVEPEDKWSYRRSGADNDYMARSEELEDEIKAKTEVMIDVSGSVDEELVKEFLKQLKPLLKKSDLRVGCFDHNFYAFKEIKNKKDIALFRVPGGGGTDLDLAVRSFTDDNDVNKIVFTDGYGNMPEPDLRNVKNLFWVVYDDVIPETEWFHPVCGKVIRVERKEISQNLLVTPKRYLGR